MEYRATMLRAAGLARDLDDHALLTAALAVTPHFGYSQDAALAHPELIERLEDALEVVGPDEPGLRARLLSALALELQFVGEPERRGQLCDEAYDLAVRSDEPTALTDAFRAFFYSALHAARTPAEVERQRTGHLELLERSLVTGDDVLAGECCYMAWWDAVYLGGPCRRRHPPGAWPRTGDQAPHAHGADVPGTTGHHDRHDRR